jgi:hypothetical protein
MLAGLPFELRHFNFNNSFINALSSRLLSDTRICLGSCTRFQILKNRLSKEIYVRRSRPMPTLVTRIQQPPTMRLSNKKLSEELNPPPLCGELSKAIIAKAASTIALSPNGTDTISNM